MNKMGYLILLDISALPSNRNIAPITYFHILLTLIFVGGMKGQQRFYKIREDRRAFVLHILAFKEFTHTRGRETSEEPGEHLTVKTPDSSYSDLITSKVDSIHHPQRNTVKMNQPKHSNCFVFSNVLVHWFLRTSVYGPPSCFYVHKALII